MSATLNCAFVLSTASATRLASPGYAPTSPLFGPSSFYGTPADHVQESFNSRLKAEGDEGSTNLYISNLPKSLNEMVS